jgi:hypothetical protein
MRQLLIIWLTNFLRNLLGRTSAAAPETDEEEEEMEKCPDCGEEWDKGEIFCYFCGYELSDEENPLHPPPVRTGALTDTDNVLNEADQARIRDKLESIGSEKGLDIAVLISSEFASDGDAYCIYNTWQMGKDTGLKGILLVIDPNGNRRFLAQGRNGPGLKGSDFRSWYDEFHPSEGESSLYAELSFIAEKIENL